jgi:hypothetical protein
MGMGHGAWGMGHWAFLVPSRSQVSRFSFPGFSFLVPRLSFPGRTWECRFVGSADSAQSC